MPTTGTTVEGNTTYVDTFADDGTPLSRAVYYPGGSLFADYQRTGPQDPYELKVKRFDAQSRLDTETWYDANALTITKDVLPIDIPFNQNYAFVSTDYDQDGTQVWTKIESGGFNLGGLYAANDFIKTFFDNGLIETKRYVTEYGGVIFTSLSSVQLTDANGNPLSLTSYQYSGNARTGTVINTFDTYGQNVWSSIRNNYDKDGLLLTVAYSNDDKSQIVYDYDPKMQFAFDTVVTTFNAAGARSSTYYTNDDKTSVIYEYDVGGSFSWSQVATYFDQAGTRTKAVYDNDDGTHVAYTFTGGQTTVTYFDASWNVVA